MPADSSVSGTTSSTWTGAPSRLDAGLSVSSHGEGGKLRGSTRILLWSDSSAMTRASWALGPTSTGSLSTCPAGPPDAVRSANPATSTVTCAEGSVSIASSVRPEQGRPRTVKSARVGDSPVQKAKSTSAGARASAGGVHTKRVKSSPEAPAPSVPIETAPWSSGPESRTVISARARGPRTSRDGSASTTGAACAEVATASISSAGSGAGRTWRRRPRLAAFHGRSAFVTGVRRVLGSVRWAEGGASRARCRVPAPGCARRP